MNCPICEQSNPDEYRFCGGCGGALGRACPSCGKLNPSDHRFCGACGTSVAGAPQHSAARQPNTYTPKHLAEKILQSRSALEGERKHLTVLFADVKGSMELAEQVDPEEWHRILDRFFRILSEGVHRFEGTVNQYTGDGIMALFGAPIAHEDHAQRACYAALHIADRLRAYADEIRLETGLSFAARIGINSGEAVVGKIGDDLRMDYTAQGQTVGLAQRMEQLAEPGRCYLTDHTARLVEGYFELRRLGDSRIKGVSEPVGVHELQRVGAIRTRFDASRSRGLSRFVGRGDEMMQLEAALEEASGGNGQVVMVVGDAGIGKSRLCFEFTERCRGRGIRVTESQAVAHGASVPLLPVLDLMRSIFEIAADDRDEVVQRKVAGALLLLAPAFQDDLGMVFELLGVPDPARPTPEIDAQLHERKVREILSRIFRLWGGGDSAVVLIEDLHWADPASEAILDEIVHAVRNTSKLLVLNYRPEYEPRWSADRNVPSQTISLAPLGPEEIRRLLEEHVGIDSGIGELLDRIERQTGGNPFYVEEVVRSLVGTGMLVGESGAYRLDRPVTEIAVPATVQATIAGRIDRLDEVDKATLQVAAVIGRKFRRDLLGEIRAFDDDELDHSLQVLVDRQFVDLEALYPEREYAFRHALTCDIAYASPLSEFRARTHRAVASAVVRRHAENLDEIAGLVAHHHEAASDHLEAARWHVRAGRWQRRYLVRAALHHWRSVRRLLARCESTQETISQLVEAGITEIEMCMVVGYSRDEVEAILSDTRRTVQQADDVSSEVALLSAYSRYLIGINAARESLATLEEAAGLASRVTNPNILVGTLLTLAMARHSAGSIAAAGEAIDECVDVMEANAASLEPIGHQSAWSFGSIVRMYQGRLEEAENMVHRADKIRKDHGTPWTVSYFASFVADRRGKPEAALKLGRMAVNLAEPDGTPFERVLAHNSFGQALLARERYQEAADHWRCGLDAARNHGVMMNVVPFQLGALGDAHIGLGEIEEARRLAEEAVQVAVAAGLGTHQCSARFGMLHVLAAEGHADELEAEIVRVEELVDRIEGHGYFDSMVREERARLAELRGDDGLRRRELEEAARLHEAIGADGHAERIRNLLRDGN